MKNHFKRFPSASTFKILHTLIALNEGLIRSEYDVLKGDAKKRSYTAWNKDQTLEDSSYENIGN